MSRAAKLCVPVALLALVGCSSETEPSASADAGAESPVGGVLELDTASTVPASDDPVRASDEPPTNDDAPTVAGGGPLPPVIDGTFDDWAGITAGVTDAAGDATGPFDVLSLQGVCADGRLALRLEITQALNLQSGPEGEETLVITVASASDPDRSIGIDLRDRSVFSGVVNPIDWGVIDYVSAPTHASTVFEMAFDVSGLGVGRGGELVVAFAGSDTPDEVLRVRSERAPMTMRQEIDPRKQEEVFRVASINTLRDGSASTERGPLIGRMLDAMDPDIICLQEERETSAGDLRSWIESHDPLDDGADWAVHKLAGNAILVPENLTVEVHPASEDRFVIGLVGRSERPMIVASIHLKCCGYIGSSEDKRRVREATAIVRAVERIRAQDDEFSDAPFVLIGDWNLVGSGGARDVVCDHPTLGAIDLAPMRLRGDRNSTWRDLTPNNGGFPPGRLDLVVVSRSLPVERSFVFDTMDLDESTLRGMGLEATDSSASDHLMLVLDVP
ncbi:MAG: endonuclease/exonuclease/phosphatase family protein [Planctomycetota bacterium]